LMSDLRRCGRPRKRHQPALPHHRIAQRDILARVRPSPVTRAVSPIITGAWPPRNFADQAMAAEAALIASVALKVPADNAIAAERKARSPVNWNSIINV
jgi:hypothetical protein